MTDDVVTLDAGTDTTTETMETVLVEVDRPFLTTPLDDYTVAEGLLLCILLVLLLKWLAGIIKEGFYWLL